MLPAPAALPPAHISITQSANAVTEHKWNVQCKYKVSAILSTVTVLLLQHCVQLHESDFHGGGLLGRTCCSIGMLVMERLHLFIITARLCVPPGGCFESGCTTPHCLTWEQTPSEDTRSSLPQGLLLNLVFLLQHYLQQAQVAVCGRAHT